MQKTIYITKSQKYQKKIAKKKQFILQAQTKFGIKCMMKKDKWVASQGEIPR